MQMKVYFLWCHIRNINKIINAVLPELISGMCFVFVLFTVWIFFLLARGDGAKCAAVQLAALMLYRKLLRWIIIYAECRLPPGLAGAGVARLGCQLSGRAACCPLLSARLLPHLHSAVSAYPGQQCDHCDQWPVWPSCVTDPTLM